MTEDIFFSLFLHSSTQIVISIFVETYQSPHFPLTVFLRL